MIGLVLVTHGRLAEEFIAATEHVVGPQKAMKAICIGPEDDMQRRRDDILRAVDEVDEGDGVILLTDMFGGTPSNLGITFLEDQKVEVVTGVNLPMLVKLASMDAHDLGLLGVARQVREHAREAIRVASDLMRPDVDG